MNSYVGFILYGQGVDLSLIYTNYIGWYADILELEYLNRNQLAIGEIILKLESYSNKETIMEAMFTKNESSYNIPTS